MSYSQIAIPAFNKKNTDGLSMASSYGCNFSACFVDNIYSCINSQISPKSTHEYGHRINVPKTVYNVEELIKSLDIGIFMDSRYIGLNKEMSLAIYKLEKFKNLDENWNENGALPFDNQLINLCKRIVTELPVVPDIYPTARCSIQFEYELGDDYLEFEFFGNHTEVYQCMNDVEKEYEIKHENNYMQKIRQVVVDFYG